MQARNIELTLDKQLGLDRLGVDYKIDNSIMPLITKDVLEASKIVVNEIRKEISDGLPVREVTLTRLDDHDAGQWSLLVFQIKVALDTKEADEAWDRIIYRISEIRESQVIDESLRTALLDRISVQLRWRWSVV